MTLATISPNDLKKIDQVASVRKYVAAASALATRKAYTSDWRQFELWCVEQGLEPLPGIPAMVATYMADQADAGKKVATLERALVAIGRAHQLAFAKEDPTKHQVVKETMKGIRRHHFAMQKKAQPLLFQSLKTVVAAMDCEKVRDVRDRPILCLGFMTGLRRFELMALDVEDLRCDSRGLTRFVSATGHLMSTTLNVDCTQWKHRLISFLGLAIRASRVLREFSSFT